MHTHTHYSHTHTHTCTLTLTLILTLTLTLTHTHTQQLIHEIAEENGGVIISFPRSGSNSDKVVLKGARQCIDGAKARFKEIIEDLVCLVHVLLEHTYMRVSQITCSNGNV